MDAAGTLGPGRPRRWGGPVSDRGAAHVPRVVGVSAVTLVLLAVGTVGGAIVYGVATGASQARGHVDPVVTSGPSCTYVAGVPPGALRISASPPSGSYPVGTTLSALVELRAVASSGLDPTGTVDLPSLSAVFGISGGTSITLVLAPRSVNVSEAGWTDPSVATASTVLAAATEFPPEGNATLSSSLIALMASAPFGALEVGARWHWALQPPGGTEVDGAWTVPSASGGVPSLLFPQPLVRPAQGVPTSGTIGTNFTVQLVGGTPGQTFPMKLENATTGATLNLGSAVSPPATVPSFRGVILLLGATGYLAAGHYLVHLHDACGSILYSWPVTATYASSADVGLAGVPGSCGPVSFDGVAYPNGSSWSGAPGPTVHTATVPDCAGYGSVTWHAGGGVSVGASSGTTASVRVSASGTLSAEFT